MGIYFEVLQSFFHCKVSVVCGVFAFKHFLAQVFQLVLILFGSLKLPLFWAQVTDLRQWAN